VGEWRADGEKASETVVARRSSAKEHGPVPAGVPHRGKAQDRLLCSVQGCGGEQEQQGECCKALENFQEE